MFNEENSNLNRSEWGDSVFKMRKRALIQGELSVEKEAKSDSTKSFFCYSPFFQCMACNSSPSSKPEMIMMAVATFLPGFFHLCLRCAAKRRLSPEFR